MSEAPLKQCPRCRLYRCACPVVGHVEPARGPWTPEGVVYYLRRLPDPLTAIARWQAIEAAARVVVDGFDGDPDSVCWPEGRPLVEQLRAALAPDPPAEKS